MLHLRLQARCQCVFLSYRHFQGVHGHSVFFLSNGQGDLERNQKAGIDLVTFWQRRARFGLFLLLVADLVLPAAQQKASAWQFVRGTSSSVSILLSSKPESQITASDCWNALRQFKGLGWRACSLAWYVQRGILIIQRDNLVTYCG